MWAWALRSTSLRSLLARTHRGELEGVLGVVEHLETAVSAHNPQPPVVRAAVLKGRWSCTDVAKRKRADLQLVGPSACYRDGLLWGAASAVTWGYSSAGRAPALQAGGQRFEPA
jgi:hypothetical protein